MLQFERKTHQSNKTKNFLALNKNLVRTKPKFETAKRNERETVAPKRKFPFRSNAVDHQEEHGTIEETVIISKDYLEQLLRQNITKDPPSEMFNSLPLSQAPPTTVTLPIRKVNSSSTSTGHHVVIDHTQIPGLQEHEKTYRVDSQPTTHEDHVPYASQHSPRYTESYHRGTMNRPIHPAMRSSINFGVGGGGGGGGDYDKMRWQPTLPNHGERKSKEESFVPLPSITLPSHSSPKTSMDLFQSQEQDESKFKDLIYREQLLMQIEENKRLKEEERTRREREDNKEAERVKRDKQRVLIEFEREKERQRRKEMDATQKLALLYQQHTQEPVKEKEKSGKYKESVDHQLAQGDVPVIQMDYDFRSPSMLPAKPRASSPQAVEKCYQKSQKYTKSMLPVKRRITGAASQISLHSTSSEEPHIKGGNNSTVKISSGLAKETRVQRRQAIKKEMNSKKSDSESESQERLSRQRGGKPSSGRDRTLPNSIVRSTKQALHRSLKEQNHNRTVRLRQPQVLLSSPDCHNRSPPSPPVPTVAKRLAQGQKTNVNDSHDLLSTDMTSINVPQEKLQRQAISSVPVLPSITAASCYNITRAPSCTPDCQPLIASSDKQIQSITSQPLPPILEIESSVECTLYSQQQQQMLECLSKLKQNIMTHSQDVKSKVKGVL